MKKLHVSELSDAEISAVFSTAVEEAVARAQGAGRVVPTISTPDVVRAQQRAESRIKEIAQRMVKEAKDRTVSATSVARPTRSQKSA